MAAARSTRSSMRYGAPASPISRCSPITSTRSVRDPMRRQRPMSKPGCRTAGRCSALGWIATSSAPRSAPSPASPDVPAIHDGRRPRRSSTPNHIARCPHPPVAARRAPPSSRGRAARSIQDEAGEAGAEVLVELGIEILGHALHEAVPDLVALRQGDVLGDALAPLDMGRDGADREAALVDNVELDLEQRVVALRLVGGEGAADAFGARQLRLGDARLLDRI